MRKEAARRGLDPDQWFNNVELVTAEKVGIETTTYVRNIYKYFAAYKLQLDTTTIQRKAREQVARAMSDCVLMANVLLCRPRATELFYTSRSAQRENYCTTHSTASNLSV